MQTKAQHLKELSLAPTDVAQVSGQNTPDPANQSSSKTKGGGSTSQATRLVALVADRDVTLFHSPEQDAYASILVNDHYEIWPLKSKWFRRWLARQFYEHEQTTPNAQAMQDAIGVLAGRALFAGEQEQVHIRLAEREGNIYLDLVNDHWQVVEISGRGWRVTNASPVYFRRTRGMLPLPVPIEGGSISTLRSFVNVANDQAWTLLLAWLLAALRPRGPYPVLVLHGEQGSGKSSLVRVLRALLDPNTCPLRAEPRDVRDVMIAANNGHVLAFDNLSRIKPWLSDAMCRLSTGGGLSTRELYTDSEEVLFEAQRPVVINGIEELATRADLLDRAIVQYLPTILDGKRRTEDRLWREFEQERPGMLGALLAALSGALKTSGQVSLDRLPRMADFAMFVMAGEQFLGLAYGAFLKAYESNRQDSNALALEASPIVPILRGILSEQKLWQGTASQLLTELNTLAEEQTKRLRSWPGSPQTVSNQLRRLVPNLRPIGIHVSFERERSKSRGRLITLEQECNMSSEASEVSERQAGGRDGADASDDHQRTLDDVAVPRRPTIRARNDREMDGVDDLDGSMLPFSDQPEEVIDLVD